MFTVKTSLQKSDIHGLGCFADVYIPKGIVIWKFVDGLDVVINDEQYSDLPDIAREYINNFGYYNSSEGGWVMCMDNSKYTNHSDDANMEKFDRYSSKSIKDIQIGEEITENYYFFDEKAQNKLNNG